ncbi:unnamed protein product [Agarophyton chilense]
MTATNDAEDIELQKALQRSRKETNLEEAMLAEALAASLSTRDEEIARSMQREQFHILEKSLCDDNPSVVSDEDPSLSAPSVNGQSVAHGSLHASNVSSPSHEPSSPDWTHLKSPNQFHHRRTPPTSSHRRSLQNETNFASASRAGAEFAPQRSDESSSAPVVVIDGQNVGYSYGGGKHNFRAKGVKVVLDYYLNKGMKAVAMLPACKVDTRFGLLNDRVADDPALLKSLAAQDLVAFTPAGSHDDHFLLAYAKQKNIDIISNDRFKKEVSEQETGSASRALQDFLNEHLIPYTFVNGEFMPNPNPHELSRAGHCSRGVRYRR